MNDSMLFGAAPGPRDDYAKLALWLQQLLLPASSLNGSSTDLTAPAANSDGDNQLALVFAPDYHVDFYRQLPAFIMALLNQDPLATIHFAPLLYHLAGCQACHDAYLDLYDAMRAAIQPQGARPLFGQGMRTLSATPHRMLGHLCQVWISQAEVVLRQARHAHSDQDAAARELLQMALRVSSHISQSSIRREALHDLVRVATLFAGPSAPQSQHQSVHAYTPVMAGFGGMRRGKVLRQADTLARPTKQEPYALEIQSAGLEGRITQQGQLLSLHLHDLAPSLRGQHVAISVLLGSLLEPVRWLGGNPHAIRSAVAVDADGRLVMPLGQTDLLLSNPEERNLLEAIFLLLEVRALA